MQPHPDIVSLTRPWWCKTSHFFTNHDSQYCL